VALFPPKKAFPVLVKVKRPPVKVGVLPFTIDVSEFALTPPAAIVTAEPPPAATWKNTSSPVANVVAVVPTVSGLQMDVVPMSHVPAPPSSPAAVVVSQYLFAAKAELLASERKTPTPAMLEKTRSLRPTLPVNIAIICKK
jgi:hypothetical protein